MVDTPLLGRGKFQWPGLQASAAWTPCAMLEREQRLGESCGWGGCQLEKVQRLGKSGGA